jgi:hypothetical protein
LVFYLFIFLRSGLRLFFASSARFGPALIIFAIIPALIFALIFGAYFGPALISFAVIPALNFGRFMA